jgi:hypothetical protein
MKNGIISFPILLMLTALMLVTINIVGAALVTPEAPWGIVSFELARTPQNAQNILGSWDARSQVRAGFIQGLDFFICSPELFIWAVCRPGRCQRPDGRFRNWPASGSRMILAAVCDIVENVALVRMLFLSAIAPARNRLYLRSHPACCSWVWYTCFTQQSIAEENEAWSSGVTYR